MKTRNTITEQITEIENKAKQEIECLKIKNSLIELGLPINLVYHSFKGKPHYSFNCETFEQAQTVKTWIESQGQLNLAKLGFASKADINTFSPYLLKFENMDHEGRSLKNSVSIRCESDTADYCIDLKSPSMFNGTILQRSTKQLKHLGFGRYNSKAIYHLGKMFGLVAYYGDHYTNYCENAEQREYFEYVLFHGEVKEVESLAND